MKKQDEIRYLDPEEAPIQFCFFCRTEQKSVLNGELFDEEGKKAVVFSICSPCFNSFLHIMRAIVMREMDLLTSMRQVYLDEVESVGMFR